MNESDDKRIYGIDYLRITAMLMIVTLHVFSFGGIIQNEIRGGQPIAWLIFIISFLGVDCFGLISGYVYYGKKRKISKLLSFWTQIVFYTLIETFIFSIACPGLISETNWIHAIFPIITQEYWYMTAYFGLYCIIPILNLFVSKIKGRFQYVLLMIVMLGYMTVKCALKVSLPWPIISSIVLLSMLYVIGAIVKINANRVAKFKKSAITLFIISIGFTLGLRMINCFRFIQNDSPSIVLASVALLVLFLNIRNLKNKYVSLFSSTTLGVYLIHTNKLFLHNVLGKVLWAFTKKSLFINIIFSFAYICVIFLVCSIIENMRIIIFDYIKRICRSANKTK